MSTLLKKENLFLRVTIGFILGVILGFAVPDIAISTKVMGDLYLNLIKLMIIPIVVCAVFCAIANIKDGSLLRRISFRTVALYVVMFIVCSVISLAIAWIIRPGLGGEQGRPVLYFMNSLSAAFFKMLGYFMEVSPLGVMSLMAFSVAQYGAGIFGALAK